ncbi:ABC transporter ATP-binding protein [Desulfobacter hydrogenophilus]|uniref:ABC transporter ATP-binding protein n=1 Tax=Desulfobacter hydrogenophilus TaxID=2291 RepID=A0A328FCC2_9BACT|nr:ABC-F family ATP-binding cassette domain-containing protein [Desulfobacter hydrogenophilus]NDY72213.1 ABC-F family ATP-binding cassette domain-containing protein [Desulfobacter hydrogenophilus]QBH15106.1 ABC transporter ATP-binding protein [Desulfobacter hydrogenophilus]RAM02218.1 ABC transporter ATP-binding protein [Desulfobacter hydrogenophilus]
MTVLVSVKELCKAYGDDTLFTDLSVDIKPGEKMGLIGMNGSGKSTLLKIICGLSIPDEGEVSIQPGQGIVYLAQEDEFDPDLSIEQVLFNSLSSLDLQEKERHRRVNRALGLSGFTNAAIKTKELSGGWRKRLAITRAFCQEPDLLLLDEPTNHLDIAGILWLEQILLTARFSFVAVSHDRAFLENVCSHTMEIARYYQGGVFKIQGNYPKFEQERDKYLEAQEKKQSSLASKMRREDQWLRQGAKARTTKAKYRIDQAEELRKELSEVKARNRQTARMDIDFSGTGRQTRKLLRVHNLTKGFKDKTLFSNITFELGPGFCLGIVGDNGSGKSTFLSLIEQSMEPDQGSVKWAENLKTCVYHQERTQLDPKMTLRDALNPAGGDSVNYKGRSIHVVSWAKRFLFMPDQLDMPVGRLSGGEKARIVLAEIMLQPCDLLLLDEPTNDLDILSLEVLETSIKEFEGAVIIVSHDRYLMDRVCHRMLYLDNTETPQFYRDFGQILKARTAREKSQQPMGEKIKKEATKPAPSKKRLFSFKDKYELEQIEEKIMDAEQRVKDFSEQVQHPDVIQNSALLADTCKKLEQAQSLVQKLYSRWEELEEKKAAADQS